MTGYFRLTGNVDLRPGTYNHTFQCMLPAQLPTSVNGQYGYIEYGIHIVLDIQLWPDKKFSEEFTVIKPINLNAVPGMRVSYEALVFSNFDENDWNVLVSLL